MTQAELDRALIAAHARADHEGLVALYCQAADQADADAAAFYLTHAYVFALEAGLGSAAEIRTRLVVLGAEPES